jgi:ABC-type polysaccharide/polyol phosphate transport system ATPase subunit
MSISEGQPAIVLEHVWKSFSRHTGQVLLRDRLVNLLHSRRMERFQALKDISLAMYHGESVALIGHNGAGKSTLLNLTTGLCRPDGGRVEVNGRIAALLDLGAGFHPDLTGAENVRINAALLGLTRRQVRESYDEVVAFSGIGDFIDEPLRTYSSGMVMRLAFSVAVCVDPDILIIDEVLGVGDATFQAKCFERIMQFRQAGKTILCVSHSTSMLEDICTRAVWLDHGRVMDDGPLTRVLQAYRVAMSSHAVYTAG